MIGETLSYRFLFVKVISLNAVRNDIYNLIYFSIKLENMIPEFLTEMWTAFVGVLPRAVGAVIALIIGWIAGRALGKAISKILDKAGVDDALRRTVFGRALERSGITCVGFFDLIVRWFIYLIAVFAAVDILRITVLSQYMHMLVAYLPNLIAGVILFIAGFIVVDYIADFMRKVGEEAEIAYSRLFVDGLRLFLYAVVTILALSQMKINVSILYIFANALAWGISIGVCVGLAIALALGFKDAIAEYAEKWIKSLTTTTKKVEETIAKKEQEGT
jgi:small-conductance mechanosensitive channel